MNTNQHNGSRREPPHARIYSKWYTLPAWRTLCSRGRDLVCHVMAAYRPDKLNAFDLSDASAAAMLGCSDNTARKVVKSCIERGWFILERRGGVKGPRGARGRVVSLSRFPAENRPAEPERFENWRPQQKPTAQNLWRIARPYDGQ